MCGIAGFVVRDSRPFDREKLLDALLLGIEPRGRDATGFIGWNDSCVPTWHKASCPASEYVRYRPLLPNGATAVLGHTRLATNGSPAFPENNHPVRRGSIYVTHNGVVDNDRDLFRQTERVPFGQVDTEAIAAALSANEGLNEHATDWLERIEGSAAIAALDERNGNVLLARVSFSPLYLLETRRLWAWASEEGALRKAHESAIGSLGRAKIVRVDEGQAFLFRDGKRTDLTFDPPFDYYSFRTSAWDRDNEGGWSSPGKGIGKVTKVATKVASVARIPLPVAGPNEDLGDLCDLCDSYEPDPYELFDGHDYWSLCASCWDTMRDAVPDDLYV